ncbi:hypothetical protein, partial [Enterococcus faecalis]
VLLYASQYPAQLQGYAASLGQLGSFTFSQLALWRHKQSGQVTAALQRSTPATDAYGLIGNCTAMDETCRLIDKVLHTP